MEGLEARASYFFRKIFKLFSDNINIMSEEQERISIEFFKPRIAIGQTIYVPQKNVVVASPILGYNARIGQEKDGKLFGGITEYHIENFVSVRRGDDSDFTSIIRAGDFYEDQRKAQEASKFLKVKLDEESWRIAVGDRKVQDENSPYNIENSNLPSCCADVSEARSILLYCKRNGGLIVHDRNEMTGYFAQSPLGEIFKQLQIECEA
jgi:hypothetical protein